MTDVATKMGAGYSKKINGVNSISLDEFGLFSRIIDFNGTHSLKADKLPVSCLPRKNRNRHRVKSLGISRIIDSYGWHKKVWKMRLLWKIFDFLTKLYNEPN